MSVYPFKINIPEPPLGDMRRRILSTRWTDEISGAGWDYGTNLSYLKELSRYWADDYDWRGREKIMNGFSHYKANIDGFNIHFINEPARGKSHFPIILIHGWPYSFLQMLKIIPILTDPEKHGGDAEDSFDVIVPSLPGYGFSDRPSEKGMTVPRITDIFVRLMGEELGHRRYGVRGSDFGAGVARQMALTHPGAISGVHLSGSLPPPGSPPKDLSKAEQRFIAESRRFRAQEGAYALLNTTKPQTLAYGLNDSPAGLAAWLVEKFRAWSDCGGDVEKRFTKDELLDNLTVYWVTQTINSSCRLYYETAHSPWPSAGKRLETPVAFAMFPKDFYSGPREWALRDHNVQRWTEMPRGGHFGEFEEPELLAEDIRSFFRALREPPAVYASRGAIFDEPF
jgi:pimeloyl-ACP methyl ester carboxylesterase